MGQGSHGSHIAYTQSRVGRNRNRNDDRNDDRNDGRNDGRNRNRRRQSRRVPYVRVTSTRPRARVSRRTSGRCPHAHRPRERPERPFLRVGRCAWAVKRTTSVG